VYYGAPTGSQTTTSIQITSKSVNESFTAVNVQRIALDTRAIGLSFKWLGASIALGTKSFVGKTRLSVAVTGTLHKC